MKMFIVAVDRVVLRLETYAAVFCLSVIVVATTSAVFWRYVLRDPLTWSADVSVVALVWLSFLGAAAILKEGGHVAASGLVEKLPGRVRRIVNTFLLVLLFVCLVLLCRYAVTAALVQSGQNISTLGVSRALYTLPVIYAAASMALWTLSALLGAEDRDRPFASAEGEQ